jgi:hypothetical protein
MNHLIAHALLLTLALASSHAAGESPTALVIEPRLQIERAAEATRKLEVPPPAPQQGAYLTFKCRIESGAAAISGSYFCLQMDLNGSPLEGDRLVNKPLEYSHRNGWVFEWYAGKMWRFPYSPDFVGYHEDGDGPYDILGVDPFYVEIDITDLVKAGGNNLRLRNTLPSSVPYPIIIEGLSVQLRPHVPRRPEATPGIVPQGPLTRFVPADMHKVAYTLAVGGDGALDVTVGGTTHRVVSSFSYPRAGWNALPTSASDSAQSTWKPSVRKLDERTYLVEARGDHYKLSRKIELRDEHIDIADTLTNLAKGDLAIAMRHRTPLETEPASVYLCGNPSPAKKGEAQFTENPAVYLGFSASGLALVSRDDVMRAQSRYTIDRKTPGARHGGIENTQFCLPEDGVYTARWSIFPTVGDDYWAYINAARRAMDVNFTIPGSFAFVYTRPNFWNMNEAQIQQFVANRGLAFTSTGLAEFDEGRKPASGAIYAHGTAFNSATGWIERTGKMITSWKAAAPAVRPLVYFHSYLSSDPQAAELYASDRVLDASGAQAIYDYDRVPRYLLFYPTTTNGYGKALDAYLETVFNVIGAQGIYWDEMSESGGDHNYTDTAWDGHTCQMDPQEFTVIRRMSSTTLLSRDYRAAVVERLQKQGHVVVANTMPQTERESKLRFPRFVETAPVSMLHKTHLYTPIGLGDSVIAEKNQADIARQIRRQLDRAALYYYYDGSIAVTSKQITACMFPFTPVQIGPGVMIGRERILVSRPGVFGWGDGKLPASIHVFDDKGAEVDGSAWIEPDAKAGTVALRLPSGYTAALIHP